VDEHLNPPTATAVDQRYGLPAFMPPLLLFVLLQTCAWAGGNFTTPERRPDLVVVLPPPPDPGSPEDQADLAALLAVQAARTPAMVSAARADAEETVFRLLARMGIALDPTTLPATASLFANLHADEAALVEPAKRHWHRLRPFAASPAVQPCAPRPWSASYPSGHAAFAFAASEALVDILPEWQDAIRARAATYARDRVVCGVHYPSDVEAGRLAGLAIAAAMRDDTLYQAALAAARSELRHALGLPPSQVSGAMPGPAASRALRVFRQVAGGKAGAPAAIRQSIMVAKLFMASPLGEGGPLGRLQLGRNRLAPQPVVLLRLLEQLQQGLDHRPHGTPDQACQDALPLTAGRAHQRQRLPAEGVARFHATAELLLQLQLVLGRLLLGQGHDRGTDHRIDLGLGIAVGQLAPADPSRVAVAHENADAGLGAGPLGRRPTHRHLPVQLLGSDHRRPEQDHYRRRIPHE
jgi:acid phosphatase (class A)